MILLIRGHIRNSFDDNNLYILLKKIIDLVGNLDIYIQTWNIFQSNLSWRTMKENCEVVTDDIIKCYFRDISENIRHILILDDSKIDLIGDLSGNICDTKAPKHGWKNMLYGICNELTYMKENIKKDILVINTRFDVLTNSCPIQMNNLLFFIRNNLYYSGDNMRLISDQEETGIDNIYIGKLSKMYVFLLKLYTQLDEIMLKYPIIQHHELIFFYENKITKRIQALNNMQYDINKKISMPPTASKVFIPKINFNHLIKNSDKKYGKVYLDSTQDKWSKFII